MINMTAWEEASTTVEKARALGEISPILYPGFLLVFFLILFTGVLLKGGTLKDALIAGSVPAFGFSIILSAFGIVDFYLPVLFLTIMILGIILKQDRDVGG